ncbi:hypothetical protein E8E13_003123 [Curvularia kusanoi]|uniref:Uncharacterized protein n=1 Tax=Curvularia kusanoi TaxID=90978 RepID=A0A9P4W3X4_CURKU|nr:hypothetical protein E8E13_003123 [Curvularia kusanoi]
MGSAQDDKAPQLNAPQQNVPQHNVPQQNVPQHALQQARLVQVRRQQQFLLQQQALLQQAQKQQQQQQQQQQPKQQQNVPRGGKVPLKRPAEDSDADVSVEEALEQLNKSCKRAKASIDAANAKDKEISDLRRALQTSTDAVAAKDREIVVLRQSHQDTVQYGYQIHNDRAAQEEAWVAKERKWIREKMALQTFAWTRGSDNEKLKNEVAKLNNHLALTQRREIEADRKLDEYKKRIRQMGEEE